MPTRSPEDRAYQFVALMKLATNSHVSMYDLADACGLITTLRDGTTLP